MKASDLHYLVYNFKTKNKEGFTSEETRNLVANNFPNLTHKKFAKLLGTNTVMVIDGEVVTYHTDVYHALIQVVENRDLNWCEID